jgi:hypothetical protein
MSDLDRPLRTVTHIERGVRDKHKAKLTLSCGHVKRVDGFPLGDPPPCFRQICEEPGCNA